MRLSLFVAALIFILGGALAVLNPRAGIIEHPNYRARLSSPPSLEFVTRKQSFVYGLISCGIGFGALYGAKSCKRWQLESDEEERARHRHE